MCPIVLRETKVGGVDVRSDKVLSQKIVLDRRYVRPKEVRPSDIVLTGTPQDVLLPGESRPRPVQLSEKELLDPAVRRELGLPAPEEEGDDEDEPRAGGTREQDEEEEAEEEAGGSDLERFVSDWGEAVALIAAAARRQDTDALADFHAAEMRRQRPRPSVVKAFVAAGLGNASDFEKK